MFLDKDIQCEGETIVDLQQIYVAPDNDRSNHCAANYDVIVNSPDLITVFNVPVPATTHNNTEISKFDVRDLEINVVKFDHDIHSTSISSKSNEFVKNIDTMKTKAHAVDHVSDVMTSEVSKVSNENTERNEFIVQCPVVNPITVSNEFSTDDVIQRSNDMMEAEDVISGSNTIDTINAAIQNSRNMEAERIIATENNVSPKIAIGANSSKTSFKSNTSDVITHNTDIELGKLKYVNQEAITKKTGSAFSFSNENLEGHTVRTQLMSDSSCIATNQNIFYCKSQTGIAVDKTADKKIVYSKGTVVPINTDDSKFQIKVLKKTLSQELSTVDRVEECSIAKGCNICDCINKTHIGTNGKTNDSLADTEKTEADIKSFKLKRKTNKLLCRRKIEGTDAQKLSLNALVLSKASSSTVGHDSCRPANKINVLINNNNSKNSDTPIVMGNTNIRMNLEQSSKVRKKTEKKKKIRKTEEMYVDKLLRESLTGKTGKEEKNSIVPCDYIANYSNKTDVPINDTINKNIVCSKSNDLLIDTEISEVKMKSPQFLKVKQKTDKFSDGTKPVGVNTLSQELLTVSNVEKGSFPTDSNVHNQLVIETHDAMKGTNEKNVINYKINDSFVNRENIEIKSVQNENLLDTTKLQQKPVSEADNTSSDVGYHNVGNHVNEMNVLINSTNIKVYAKSTDVSVGSENVKVKIKIQNSFNPEKNTETLLDGGGVNSQNVLLESSTVNVDKSFIAVDDKIASNNGKMNIEFNDTIIRSTDYLRTVHDKMDTIVEVDMLSTNSRKSSRVRKKLFQILQKNEVS